jgi:hypothetical protein
MAGLQAIASVYYGVIGGLGLAAGLVGAMSRIGRLWPRRAAVRVVLAIFVAAILAAPFALPYWQVQRREGFGRNLYEAAHHSARPLSYLSAPPANRLYGRTGLLAASEGPERELFPGFLLIALALLGIATAGRRDARPLAAGMIAVATLGFVLSLGPDGVRPVYAAFHRFVFGFQAIRAPARFAVLVTFALAVLAAGGTTALTRIMLSRFGRTAERSRRLQAAAAAPVVALVALEYLSAPLALVPAPPSSTPLARWLRDAPSPGAVVFLPMGLDSENTPLMVQSLEHGRPIVNGYSGQRPVFYATLVDTLARFPSSDAIWALHDVDVRYVVTDSPVATAGWPLEERTRTSGTGPALDGPAYVYELQWSPEIEAALAPPATPPVPEPGALPFAIGERAEYDVFWIGGVSTLPAGRAVIEVADPPLPDPASRGGAEPAFTFRVTAETAPWVSRFFEARDVFETVADRRLLPLAHVRHLREGRRVADQAALFDHERQVVRFGPEAQPNVSLRIPRDTRDPLTAFYYVRTLALEPGRTLTIPVNDLGRNLLLDLRATGVERLRHRGRDVETLRLEPVFRQRIERRRPVDVVAWLARDERRLPIRVDVAAGFGSLRLELR